MTDGNREQLLGCGGVAQLVALLEQLSSEPTEGGVAEEGGTAERIKCVACGCLLNVANQNGNVCACVCVCMCMHVRVCVHM